MKTEFFRKSIYYLQRHPSPFLKKIELLILTKATAEAFGITPPKTIWMHADKSLHAYAIFTKTSADHCETDTKTLYEKTKHLGILLRKITGFQNEEDLANLLILLYRNLNITLQGNIPEEIIIPNCYFSRIYTPKECAIISALDSGIVAGLFGEGQLHFNRRITEGCTSCRACFRRSHHE